MNLSAAAISVINGPIFRDAFQLDNAGNFKVEFDVPGQSDEIRPVHREDGLRYYTVKLYLNGETILSENYREGSTQEFYFQYLSNIESILTGTVTDGDGNESDIKECRFVIVFSSSGYAVDFENCDDAVLSDCVIEGRMGGILVRGSALQVLDCEIILNAGGTFISEDGESSVLEQNVRKVTR